MTTNPLLKIRDHGQCIWLDNLDRRLLENGELQGLITEVGLHGITSNPAIFAKAITGSDVYDGDIADLAGRGASSLAIYRDLTVADITAAARLFRPLHDESEGRHGFVSLEVNPHLARDTQGTVAEARELWNAVAEPNLMIKVPATREGLPAIRSLIAEGINVNVTLLFGLQRYREVAEAYLAGLNDRVGKGLPVDRVASVASFFLSRIDTMVDAALDDVADGGGDRAEAARRLRGQVAIASARQAYVMYRRIFGSGDFAAAAERGARPQRLLWASTSTKDPQYDDVKYVEALIGPETVNTLPGKTLEAYRDHGDPAARLQGHEQESDRVLADLDDLGIDLDRITARLVDEGIEKFERPYDELLRSLERRRQESLYGRLDPLDVEAGDLAGEVAEAMSTLEERRAHERIPRRDSSLWSDDLPIRKNIEDALGWLKLTGEMGSRVDELQEFARRVRDDGFTHVVHVGMGGSSMTPLTLTGAVEPGSDAPELIVLDTTDPRTAARLLDRLPLDTTLVVLASKSGTTVETRSHGDLFLERIDAAREQPGTAFAAITDEDTPLAELADQASFRARFLNPGDVGGRYSALSYFGLVSAALHGMDPACLLERADRMVKACGDDVPAQLNPGLELGAALGGLAGAGRDKITFVTPPRLRAFEMWLEQLLAESTGKDGRGLIPVAGEPLGPPEVYGSDRVFVRFTFADEDDEDAERMLKRLTDAGHPLVTIELQDELDLAQEFFRWEYATAAVGVILDINPFDQPNVQESKDNTRRLLEQGASGDAPTAWSPAASADGLDFFTSDEDRSEASDLLRGLFAQPDAGAYVAVLAYLPTDDDEVDGALANLRRSLRDHLHLATTTGYGPRYLHSTGQLHKGGPASGLFLLLTAEGGPDCELPGRDYTLGTLQRAQAAGDLAALGRHGRRVLRVHLGNDPVQGLTTLQTMIDQALAAQRTEEGRT